MKKYFKIFIIIFIIFIISAGIYLNYGLKDITNIAINPIDITKLEDGVYTGSFNYGRWTNEVSVTVKNKKIVSIDVLRKVQFEQSNITQDIINRVIEKQNTDIDIVSGATATSKAYLKSIENALLNK